MRTVFDALSAYIAAVSPAGPAPTTIMSYVFINYLSENALHFQ
jgi:hypothetical protein